MLLILTHPSNSPDPYVWLQLFGLGAGNMFHRSASPLPLQVHTNKKCKYKTSNSPSLMVSVCMPSLQHAALFWPPRCLFLVLFFPLSPHLLCPLVSVIVQNVTSLYAHTWKTKTGCLHKPFLFTVTRHSFASEISVRHSASASHVRLKNISAECVDASVRHYLYEVTLLTFVFFSLIDQVHHRVGIKCVNETAPRREH